jgi:hypothetical protein
MNPPELNPCPLARKFSRALAANSESSNEKKKQTQTPPNLVKFRLAGFPLDVLDQKRMRRLRKTSDRTGLPIPDLITEAVDQVAEAWLAKAELPNKIVKFPTAAQ